MTSLTLGVWGSSTRHLRTTAYPAEQRLPDQQSFEPERVTLMPLLSTLSQEQLSNLIHAYENVLLAMGSGYWLRVQTTRAWTFYRVRPAANLRHGNRVAQVQLQGMPKELWKS